MILSGGVVLITHTKRRYFTGSAPEEILTAQGENGLGEFADDLISARICKKGFHKIVASLFRLSNSAGAYTCWGSKEGVVQLAR